MKQVGVYSGTFDPIHKGHVAFATQAAELFNLDRVYFMIEPRPRRKQGVKAFEHRVKMTQIAIKSNAKLGTVVLDQARFTPHDTLPLLLARFRGAKLNMLVGDDTLDHISDWPHIEELLSSVNFIIGVRGRSVGQTCDILKNIEDIKGQKISYDIFKPKYSSASSSKIKQDLKAARDTEYLDHGVYEYIVKNKLYQPAKN